MSRLNQILRQDRKSKEEPSIDYLVHCQQRKKWSRKGVTMIEPDHTEGRTKLSDFGDLP